MALAGGVFVQSTPIFYRSCLAGEHAVRPRTLHTFDERADGFVPGEGAGVVVLKWLADALRDSDQVLRRDPGSGMNQDGTTNGLTAPSAGAGTPAAQRARARRRRPRRHQLIEAHGTGTPLGDPIEYEALRAAFGDCAPEGRLRPGSVKTNLGHTEFAAGVAGVIKVLLALRNEQLPPRCTSAGPTRRSRWRAVPFTSTPNCARGPHPPTVRAAPASARSAPRAPTRTR